MEFKRDEKSQVIERNDHIGFWVLACWNDKIRPLKPIKCDSELKC